MGLGEPLSLALGGGPSPQDEIYNAMRQNVGDGIRADADTLVEKWRRSRACGIAVFTQDDRATMQAFPDLSIDYLPIWEDLLDIPVDPDASITARQETVLAAYTRAIDATYPKLTQALQSIDSLMSILLVPFIYSRVTVPGRAFQDWDPSDPEASGPAFDLQQGSAGPNATAFPNYSSDFILNVLFNVGSTLGTANQRKLSEAADELNESLPAWVDYRLFTDCGFILDSDILDVTAMCDGVVIP